VAQAGGVFTWNNRRTWQLTGKVQERAMLPLRHVLVELDHVLYPFPLFGLHAIGKAFVVQRHKAHTMALTLSIG
jgi:hypothetical protein